MGSRFVREVDGVVVNHWYQGLTAIKGLSPGMAVRHFNVMHHMMGKTSAIWSRETGIDRNPADAVEAYRPDDQRERYLEVEEICRVKSALDSKMYRQAGKGINKTFFRLRMIVLIALTTGMQIAEIFGLKWRDVQYKMRYVPMAPELADETQAVPGNSRTGSNLPPEPGAKRERQRVDKSFETVLGMARIEDFRFHDLRHTFASWYMMNGGDLYELAKSPGHSNIRMTERYAKLGKKYIARTGSTAREMWKIMEAGRRKQMQGTV